MNKEISQELFIKYKKVVNNYFLFNGNLSFEKISELMDGLSIGIIRAALNHCFEYPELYKSNILQTNYKSDNNLVNKEKNDTVGSFNYNKTEMGIKTMNLWNDIYNEIKKNNIDKTKILENTEFFKIIKIAYKVIEQNS